MLPFSKIGRMIFSVVPGGTDGEINTASPFLRPAAIFLLTDMRALRSASLFFNPTGTATILISEFFDACTPFEVRVSFPFFIDLENVSEI